MIVKVCGITKEEQYNWLVARGIDLIGLNFYPQSKRFLNHTINKNTNVEEAKPVGIFVDTPIDEIDKQIDIHHLQLAQLHGHESAEYCAKVAARIAVIKAFGIDDDFDFSQVEPYMACSKYFLFDTKSINFGGSGRKFNWQKLDEYKLDKPFLLSGGITLEDLPEIIKLDHQSFAGIDINSGFEVSPGIKDLDKIDQMMKLINK